jgi:hypothetical protein
MKVYTNFEMCVYNHVYNIGFFFHYLDLYTTPKAEEEKNEEVTKATALTHDVPFEIQSSDNGFDNSNELKPEENSLMINNKKFHTTFKRSIIYNDNESDENKEMFDRNELIDTITETPNTFKNNFIFNFFNLGKRLIYKLFFFDF